MIRSLWLLDRSLVVVADQIETSSIESLQYHWHGDPLASWWAHDDWALIHTEAADLWFTSPQFPVLGDNIARLPGSRGQLTLSVESRSPVNVVWWIFFLGDAPVSYQLSGNGKSMDVLGTSFAV